MRIQLTDEDAERVRVALRTTPDLPALVADRLLDTFTDPDTLTAVLRPLTQWDNGPEGGPECSECCQSIHWHEDLGMWLHLTDQDHVVVTAELVPTCPKCNGQSFGYREGCEDWRSPDGFDIDDDGSGGLVKIWSNGWDDIGESGDDDPGLICEDARSNGCGSPIDLPEGWEIEFT